MSLRSTVSLIDFCAGVAFGAALTWLVLQWLAGPPADPVPMPVQPPVEVNGVY